MLGLVVVYNGVEGTKGKGINVYQLVIQIMLIHSFAFLFSGGGGYSGGYGGSYGMGGGGYGGKIIWYLSIGLLHIQYQSNGSVCNINLYLMH